MGVSSGVKDHARDPLLSAIIPGALSHLKVFACTLEGVDFRFNIHLFLCKTSLLLRNKCQFTF